MSCCKKKKHEIRPTTVKVKENCNQPQDFNAPFESNDERANINIMTKNSNGRNSKRIITPFTTRNSMSQSRGSTLKGIGGFQNPNAYENNGVLTNNSKRALMSGIMNIANKSNQNSAPSVYRKPNAYRNSVVLTNNSKKALMSGIMNIANKSNQNSTQGRIDNVELGGKVFSRSQTQRRSSLTNPYARNIMENASKLNVPDKKNADGFVTPNFDGEQPKIIAHQDIGQKMQHIGRGSTIDYNYGSRSQATVIDNDLSGKTTPALISQTLTRNNSVLKNNAGGYVQTIGRSHTYTRSFGKRNTGNEVNLEKLPNEGMYEDQNVESAESNAQNQSKSLADQGNGEDEKDEGNKGYNYPIKQTNKSVLHQILGQNSVKGKSGTLTHDNIDSLGEEKLGYSNDVQLTNEDEEQEKQHNDGDRHDKGQDENYQDDENEKDIVDNSMQEQVKEEDEHEDKEEDEHEDKEEDEHEDKEEDEHEDKEEDEHEEKEEDEHEDEPEDEHEDKEESNDGSHEEDHEKEKDSEGHTEDHHSEDEDHVDHDDEEEHDENGSQDHQGSNDVSDRSSNHNNSEGDDKPPSISEST